MNSDPRIVTRRDFVRASAAAGAVITAFPHIVLGAEPDKLLKIGLVGCGGRGVGAAHNAMAADPNVKVTALADMFAERVEDCAQQLKKNTGIDIAPDHRFVGEDAYRKLLETDVDIVILATPPYFRPKHFEACINAGKHVFMEKPAAVDPVGARSIMATGRKADEKKLVVVAGTQRRHQLGYVETIRRIHDGAIGRIVSAQVYWNGGMAKYYLRKQGWSDMEWMLRDWFNWRWLSGDHIVEQHMHNIDVANWVIGTHPIKAHAMGGRHRRVTGDQYDFFATDFTYPGEVHVASQCRQIHGCKTEVAERVIGEKGYSNCDGFISTIGELDFEKRPNKDAYVQEHRDLIRAIRNGERLNEAQAVAESTLAAIMARTSAYTGQEVTWEQMMKSDEVLGPPDYELTEENIRAHIPVPGSVRSA
jgi:myo-inositol 2-dehydrogenase/D-chiro-inositol 1-dehydrogenase